MSLLLEALKKAELAKQAAKGGASSRAPSMELQLEPEIAEPVITREKLPDISQPLDISAEDLPSSQMSAPMPATEPAPMVAPPPPPPVQERRPMPPDEPASAEDSVFDGPAPLGAGREAAKQLFEVKEINYNPKRPFYITLTLLGLCAAGYGGYLWWQLQPNSLAFNPNAVKDGAKPAPVADAAAPADAPPATPGAPSTPATQTATGAIAQTPATGAASGPATPVPAATKSAAAPAAEPARPQTGRPPPRARAPQQEPEADPSAPRFTRSAPVSAAPAPRASTSVEGRPARSTVSVQRATPSVDPAVARAYDAYNAGDLATAKTGYEQALQRDPRNRDALLGLAAIDQRTGNPDMADIRYQRLLELDPRDSQALAGQLSLRSQNDPLQTESRIKSLLANQPDAPHLRFALGNQYAQQGRWNEAQPEYFRAWTAEPENPDYAFNLAVSLDHMRQPKLALEYYQKALLLAQKRPAAFNAAQAAARVQQLQR